jgi:hypothetical protein
MEQAAAAADEVLTHDLLRRRIFLMAPSGQSVDVDVQRVRSGLRRPAHVPQSESYGSFSVAFGGECAGPLPSLMVPVSLYLDEDSQNGVCVSMRMACGGRDSVAAASPPRVHGSEVAYMPALIDKAVPDGAVLHLHSVDNPISMVRLWGDATARCCVSALMLRQLAPDAAAGGHDSTLEQGGDVLGLDSSGQLYLLSHQSPACPDDLAPDALMAGHNVEAACQMSLTTRAWVLRQRGSWAHQRLLDAERIESLDLSLPRKPPVALALGLHGVVLALLGLRQGPATHKLMLVQAAMVEHPCCRPILGNSHRHARRHRSSRRGVLDGDVLALFLELHVHQQEELCRGTGLSTAEAAELIDGLITLAA